MTTPYSFSEMSLELVREFPGMVPELLSSVFEVELPKFATVAAWEREENYQSPFWLERYHSLRDWGRPVAPLGPESYEPEQQLVLGYVDLVDKHPAHVILFEGLRHGDDEKRFSWPFRMAQLRARYRCNATLAVFCTDEKAETWAAQTVSTGQPNWDFRPLVLGRSTIPVITTPERAERNPPIAILSAMRHVGDPAHGDDVFRSMMWGLASLDEEHMQFYLNRLLAASEEKVANHLKGLLLTDSTIEDFYLRLVRCYKTFGRADGVAAGKSAALLRVLEARGIDVPEKTRPTILRSRSKQLDEWLPKAATAQYLEEVFGWD